MKTKERCFKYGSWFEYQIKTLKKMNPNAMILVIGPVYLILFPLLAYDPCVLDF